MSETNPRSGNIVKTASVFLVIAGVVLLVIYAKGLLLPIVVAAYLAMLLFPFVNWMEHKKVPRILAITIAMFISLAVIVGLSWFFADQIRGFSADLPDIQTRLDQITQDVSLWLNNTLGIKQDIDVNNLDKKAFAYIQDNASSISSMAFETLGSLAILVLIPVYTFMFLLYRDHFTQFIIRRFSNHDSKNVIIVVSDLRRVIQKYISGVLKVMVILTVLNATAYFSLGIKHALFFAVFGAILNVVPYVGPLVGSIVPITYALLTKDSIWYPIGVFVCFHVIQTIEGNFLTPKIVGSNVSLNPVASLIALLLGGYFWGVAGMVVFIPAFAILKKLLELHPKTADYGFLMGEEDMELRRRNGILIRFIQRSLDRGRKK